MPPLSVLSRTEGTIFLPILPITAPSSFSSFLLDFTWSSFNLLIPSHARIMRELQGASPPAADTPSQIQPSLPAAPAFSSTPALIYCVGRAVCQVSGPVYEQAVSFEVINVAQQSSAQPWLPGQSPDAL